VKGLLTSDLTPYIDVAIGHNRETCIIDTGFSGAIYLNQGKIEELNLPFLTSAPIALANKSEVIADVFETTVAWFSVNRRVAVVGGPVGCETLIGMELLAGCRIELDEVAHEIRIELL
jgi:predicted aspartyl protease